MGIGKKFLSAFVEVDDSKEADKPAQVAAQPVQQFNYGTTANMAQTPSIAPDAAKFKGYFDKLFNEANLPGPDYYEYSKMLEAMQAVPDERVRFITAFAGLSVQGLDKTKLVATAEEYVKLLDSDAKQFLGSVDAALQEKVVEKRKQMTEKEQRIQQLSQEILNLQTELQNMQTEVKENEAKIEANTSGYKAESAAMKSRINQDIEKIKNFIQ